MVSMDFFSIYLFLICLLNIKDCFGMGPMWTDVQRGASPCYTESNILNLDWDKNLWGTHQETSTKFRTRRMPLPYTFPEVGNGHLASVVLRDTVFMNGLYNGELGKSHRARIPSTNNLYCIYTTKPLKDVIHELDVATGIFSQTFMTEFFNLTHKTFAHREIKELLVTTLEFKRIKRQTDTEEITMYNDDGSREYPIKAKDIQFVETTVRPGTEEKPAIIHSQGNTITPERPWSPPPPSTETVHRYHHDLSDGTGAPGTGRVIHVFANVTTRRWTFLTSISSSKAQAWKSFLYGSIQARTNSLEDSHKEAWARYRNSGRIEVKGPNSLPIAQAINGALYYLMSSSPMGRNNSKWPFFGLSPGGLAHGHSETDYSGHVFWDQDTWMFPPFLLLHSDVSRQLLSARTRILKESQVKARRYGYKGAMFPWEAAFTGVDVCPGESYIKAEIHVTSDVAFAIRQYLYTTNDTTFLTDRDTNGANVIQEIAKFWESRISPNQESPHRYSVIDVMCPDEYGWGDDNGFTNYGAKLALQLPSYALPLVRKRPQNPLWAAMGENITMLFDKEKNFHPEYQQYAYRQQVKQADVILLGFPLMMKMSRAVRKKDLQYYEEVTDPNGPAMTWGMFSVGWLELGNKTKGRSMFEKNLDYIQEPFKIWTETAYRAGAVNFLTGMGGFLQAILFGYGGIRINSDCLFLCPSLLPNVTEIKFIGIDYQGYSFDLQVKANYMFVTLTSRAPYTDRRIYLLRQGYGKKWMYYVGQKYTFFRGPALIFTKNQEKSVNSHKDELLSQVSCLT